MPKRWPAERLRPSERLEVLDVVVLSWAECFRTFLGWMAFLLVVLLGFAFLGFLTAPIWMYSSGCLPTLQFFTQGRPCAHLEEV